MFDLENQYTSLLESLPYDSNDGEDFNTTEFLDTLDTNDCSEIPF